MTKNVYQSSAIDTVKLNAGTYYIGIYTNDEKATGKISLKKAASLSKVTISSVSGKKKGFSVKWKKVASASGYQVQYATDSKMKSAKSKKVSSSNASFSVSGLKAKKTYYVRVRAYSKNADGTTTYGNWSSIKSVKTK